jgi:D-alanine--poly(phosphoribitol) ligase subunit 1
MNFNLANPVFEHARRNGSRLAVSVAGSDLSYSELAALAQRIARWLTAGPSRPPGFVGILASRSVEAYAGVLGACWAGDAYVPLNPQLPAERLAQLLRIVQPVALVVDEAGRKALSGAPRDACPSRILSGFDELPVYDPEDRPQPAGAEDTGYMIFTSGSTGVPKGVLVPNRAVHHLVNMLQEVYGFGPGDRFSKAYNLSFDGSVHDMFTAWNAGGSLHPVPATMLMAPMKFIQERRLTVWASVPSTAVFLERLKMLPAGAFPSLRCTIFSGEPLPLRSALAWQQAAPNSVVDNICGHTECCVFSTLERLTDPPNVTPNRGLVAIGKPLPGFEAAVFDESCTPLPAGKEGELALSGPQVAKGYFLDPERTAARFPVIGGKRWYRTGDLVYRDDSGTYHHLGRIDNQVKILGHRVELGEVEAHLSEICDSDSVAAVAWPVDHGSARGIVAFHCSEGRSPQEIRDAMGRRVPRYAVPTQVLRLTGIPLTANGKVDRKALIEVLEAGGSRMPHPSTSPVVSVG